MGTRRADCVGPDGAGCLAPHGCGGQPSCPGYAPALRSRADGWYLWDYDRCEVVRGPYKTDEAAGAVRREIEGDRNLWIADAETIDSWEAELGR